MSDSTNNTDEGLSMLKKMKTEVQNKQRESAKKTSKLSLYVPKSIKDTFGNITTKQMVDVTLFVGGIFCMYKFGSSISEKLDNFMPNEE